MNANLVKTGRLRRSPQGQGTLYPLLPSVKSAQRKPVFQVLEDSATSDALVTKTEHEAVAKVSQRPITSIRSLNSISYAFSFPLCDLLVCEFPEFVTNSEQSGKNGHTEPTVTSVTSNLPVKISRVMHYIYQKVVRRKAIPFQPSPKNPSYLLCYVEEELECGHKVTVHQSEIETLTARKRNCHECSSWFGGLRLPEGKKANASILRSYERIKKQAGETPWWAVIFAAGCMIFMVVLFYVNRPHVVIFSPANNQTIVRILHQYNDFDWQIQRVVNGIPQTPEVRRFDEKPPFEAGMTLTWLAVDDRGTVWSVKHINPYYVLLRENGVAALAPNCHHSHPEDWTKDHSVCKGEPQW